MHLIHTVPVPQMQKQSVAGKIISAIDEIFDRAGDSTGGVKEEKGLWLACQSTGNSTGGRAHGLTAMLLVFFLLNSLMSSLSSSRRDTEISKEHERRRPS